MAKYVHFRKVANFKVPLTSNVIYSDGSKIGCKIGAACFHPWSNQIYYMQQRGKRLTSVHAELAGIYLGIDAFKYNPDIIILTDSLSSIDLLCKMLNNPPYFIGHSHGLAVKNIVDLLKLRSELRLHTSIWKVKAHSGLYGNNVADTWARIAAKL